MTISTQTVGIVAMAVMSVAGLAVAADVLSHRSVSERMLYYQAEEVAMDIEIMQDWGGGSWVSKSFRTSYTSLTKTNHDGRTWLALGTEDTTMEAPVKGDFTVEGGEIENFNCIWLNKTSSGVEIDKAGACV
jgi:hypothetical protein